MKDSLFFKQSLMDYKNICDQHDVYYSEHLFHSIVDSFSKQFIDDMNKHIFLLPVVKKFFIDQYVKYKTSFYKVKKCIFRYIYHQRKSCNLNDLSGIPFTEYKPSEYFFILHDSKKYTFLHTDFYNIIQSSLLNSDENLISNPLVIKNPYTGITFNHNMLYLLYLKLKKAPLLFIHFMECKFDIQQFLLNHEGLLRHYSIKKKINELTSVTTKHAILEMIFDISLWQLDETNIRIFNIQNDILSLKPLLIHYYNFIYSLNPYQRQMEYSTLVKKMVLIHTV